MSLRRWQAYLFPGAAESDDGFRRQIQRLGATGLQVAGGVTIGTTLFLTVGRFFVQPEPETLRLRLIEAAVMFALGSLNFLFASWPKTARRARAIAVCSSLVGAATLILFSLLITAVAPSYEDFIPSLVTLVLLVSVAAYPLRPGQSFAMGVAMCVIYTTETSFIHRTLYLGSGPVRTNLLFIMMLSVLAAGLSGLLYRQRYLSYVSYERSLQAAEELREAQTRAMIAEQSITIAQIAAALSHEMNNPLGALKSSVDTLLLLTARQATAPPEDHCRLVRLQSDLRKAAQESIDRLSRIVTRMQRFSNLDQAEVQAADLNQLVEDAVALHRANLPERVTIETQFAILPRLECRPSQLSSVFHGIIAHALRAIGEASGLVRATSILVSNGIDVIIDHDGPPLRQEQLTSLFDPGFQVTGDRIASGNWGMFGFRRMVREHGGEITVQSPLPENEKRQGTRFRIHLPLRTAVSGA
ncbi:HAMP domain-containing sensor histidine kinase [uncultured Paludibaculum sp.]|uniref:sensor histidine kinase n=1 Tax=uncultured Paludibaculum sp. TaxID=1765020 RepID=UPI002AABE986|nr:HAMP domain-containing sensor histidine kinase [uncultured Paludibaculum sp.]